MGRRISIHAPPRGATWRRGCNPFLSWHFNSRPSARGDAAARNCPDSSAGFQFTPLREGRPGVSFSCPLWLSISIHAPPRGATRCAGTAARPTIFQFTPLREGRQRRKKWYRDATRFQFTPLREGRRARKARRHATARFQFTPLREGRRRRTTAPAWPTAFQFTPLREGRQASGTEIAK